MPCISLTLVKCDTVQILGDKGLMSTNIDIGRVQTKVDINKAVIGLEFQKRCRPRRICHARDASTP